MAEKILNKKRMIISLVLRCLLILPILLVGYVWIILHVEGCGWLPFQSYIPAFKCDRVATITLVEKQYATSHVKLSDDGVHYKHITFGIPRTYSKTEDHTYTDTIIIKTTSYPNFIPWYEAKGKNLQETWGDKDPSIIICIKVLNAKIDFSRSLIRSNYLKTQHNLEEYISKEKNPLLSREIEESNRTFVPIDKSYPIKTIECPGPIWKHNGRCIAHLILNDHLYGEYEFDYKDLEHWQEIDWHVRNLIFSFISTSQVEKVYLINLGVPHEAKTTIFN